MRYPTMAQVEAANDLEICRWFQKLPIPIGEEQGKVLDTICNRHDKLPKLNPETQQLLDTGVRHVS